MWNIDEGKLLNAEDILTAEYGALGTESRNRFDDEAYAYYHGIIQRESRKPQKTTQQAEGKNGKSHKN